MFVLNEQSRIISLPYTLDGKKGFYHFVPGKNEIHPDVWKAIVISNSQRFDNYYSGVLRVFQAQNEKIVIAESNGIEDHHVQIEIPIGIDKIDLSTISLQAALDLIENTTKIEDLIDYQTQEEAQKRPRKPVLKAIQDKIAEIEEFDRKRKGI